MRYTALDQIVLRVPTLEAALRLYDANQAVAGESRQMSKDGLLATLMGMLRYAEKLEGFEP